MLESQIDLKNIHERELHPDIVGFDINDSNVEIYIK